MNPRWPVLLCAAALTGGCAYAKASSAGQVDRHESYVERHGPNETVACARARLAARLEFDRPDDNPRRRLVRASEAGTGKSSAAKPMPGYGTWCRVDVVYESSWQ